MSEDAAQSDDVVKSAMVEILLESSLSYEEKARRGEPIMGRAYERCARELRILAVRLQFHD